ncbi:MAG: hypothetical protein AAFX80_09955 [Cyanobacteria bacterium J06639_18]
MSTGKKGFQENNKHRFMTSREKPLVKTVTIRITEEQKQILKNTPNWQERLRQYIDSFRKDECE